MAAKIANAPIINLVLISVLITSSSLFTSTPLPAQEHNHKEYEGLYEKSDSPGETESHEQHDPGEDEVVVRLSEEAMHLAGIETKTVSEQFLHRTIELPGVVGLNEDDLAHIAPRFPGIVMEVRKNIGDRVEKGETLAIIESNESLTSYPITARIEGIIIDKHLTLGEFVAESAHIYTIADLSTVWINLAVYAKDASIVKIGQQVVIEAIGSESMTEGTISYLSPLYDKRSRSFNARIVISNRRNEWRPGTFVRGLVKLISEKKVPVIQQNAVQIIDDASIVFIPGEELGEFHPVPVILGEADMKFVQVISGLHVGDVYVDDGAFDLKAKVVTSELGGHAGHGH